MQQETLALVALDNSEEIFAARGEISHDLFVEEFQERVKQLARPIDKVVAVQPHKLCVLLRGVEDPVQIELAAAKLIRLFEPPISVIDEDIQARVRAAFVTPGQACQDENTRLRSAEAGLSEARRANAPFVIRDGGSADPGVDSFERGRDVQAAFDRGEFVMYFQSQVQAAFRNVVGAEALMRWHDPKLGVRGPAEFLPYLGDRAILQSMTWFAIKSSVAQCAAWPSELSVSVNVSPLLARDDALVAHVKDSLAIFDLAPSRLTLEITEDVMLDEPGQALDILIKLSELGVKIAIDDFGTGYSSLSYFRDLPVNELKIDRSFISKMLERPRDHDIVKGIVDLAHHLSLEVVAEGVEDNLTADELQALGVDRLQGYWFSEPLSDEAFRASI